MILFVVGGGGKGTPSAVSSVLGPDYASTVGFNSEQQRTLMGAAQVQSSLDR